MLILRNQLHDARFCIASASWVLFRPACKPLQRQHLAVALQVLVARPIGDLLQQVERNVLPATSPLEALDLNFPELMQR